MAQKTEDRFLRIIHNIKELPPFLQDIVLHYNLDPSKEKIIYIPPQSYPIPNHFLFINLPYKWRITPYRLLVFKELALTIISVTSEKSTEYINIPIRSIIDAIFSTQLLYAYLLLRWEDEKGLQEKRIEYNTVGELFIRNAFSAFWQLKIKQSLLHSDNIQPCSVHKIQADLSSKPIPIKFSNYLHYSCLPEEQAHLAIFQPIVRGKSFFKPIISPPRMTIITDRQIIFLEEELGYASQYSIIIHYCPFDSIKQIEIHPDEQYIWITFVMGKNYSSITKTIPLFEAGSNYFINSLKQLSLDLIMTDVVHQ